MTFSGLKKAINIKFWGKKSTFHNCLVIHFSFRNKITFISKFWFRYTLWTYGCMCAYMYVCMHRAWKLAHWAISKSLFFLRAWGLCQFLKGTPERNSCISAYLDGMAGLCHQTQPLLNVCLLRQGLIMYPDMISTLTAIFP